MSYYDNNAPNRIRYIDIDTVDDDKHHERLVRGLRLERFTSIDTQILLAFRSAFC